jgi:cation:H+ antiporter
MFQEITFLVIGGLLLFFGGDWLVDGVAGLAKRFRVPPVVVAFVVMGFGTSAPELFVSVNAVMIGSSDLAVGNVVGSNIANLLLVLALAALITPLPIKRQTLWFDGTAILVAAVAFWILASDGLLSGGDAILLIGGMFGYLWLRWQNLGDEEEESEPEISFVRSGVLTVLALLALPAGAHCFVEGASSLAIRMGVPESLIGLTIVAVGTSLPEVAACVAAAIRKKADMVIGGVLGSNVFNGTIVIGASALVHPIAIPVEFQAFWLPLMTGATVVSLLLMLTGYRLTRLEGAVMLIGYAAIFAF